MAVPLSTIKNALKINYSDDDADLLRYRIAAIETVEQRTGRNLSVKPATMYIGAWSDVLLPAVPFQSVTSVGYTDSSNTAQTLDSSLYFVDFSAGPIPFLRFKSGLPATAEYSAIAINYQAGYDGPPEALVHCVIALVGGWYNNPEAFQAVGLQAVPMSVDFVLSLYDARNLCR